jgi:Holliday junction resolvasome RuvABC DNA-binding subunit
VGGLIIDNSNCVYSVFDKEHKTIVRELRNSDVRILANSDEENKKTAERIFNAYSKILKDEKSPIVMI